MSAASVHKAIIVDDEPKLIAVLKLKIARLFDNLEIVDTASNVEEAYQKIIIYNPEIVFLDISMPLESGFDLLDKFNSIDFQIIFVTGNNGLALNSLIMSNVGYILKPIDDSDLLSTINKSLEQINANAKNENYQVLKDNLDLIGDQNSKIYLPLSENFEFVIIADIIRCESINQGTKIYLRSKKEINSTKSLTELSSLLIPFKFHSIHISHLVNSTYLKRIIKDEDVVMLSDGTKIPISPQRKLEFVSSNFYESFIK